MYKKICLFIIVLVGVMGVGWVGAQDDDELELPITAVAWQRIDSNAPPDFDGEPAYVVFLESDDGATLYEIEAGVDTIYTRNTDGSYSAAPLMPTDAYELTATLVNVNDDTRRVHALLNYGNFASERNLDYLRTEIVYELWVEQERELTEYSMFGECLGLVDATPPRTYARPDPIVPIRFDEEEGTLYLGNLMLSGGPVTYMREEEDTFGIFGRVTTETAIVSEGRIEWTFHSIADERDDCELRFNATYVYFDGDYAALMERAISLGTTD